MIRVKALDPANEGTNDYVLTRQPFNAKSYNKSKNQETMLEPY